MRVYNMPVCLYCGSPLRSAANDFPPSLDIVVQVTAARLAIGVNPAALPGTSAGQSWILCLRRVSTFNHTPSFRMGSVENLAMRKLRKRMLCGKGMQIGHVQRGHGM